MPIYISGQPTLVESPGFAGITVRVPLSEAPPEAWLDRLLAQGLVGKGYRVVDDSLHFFLDRGSRDIQNTMKRLNDAVNATSAEWDANAAQHDARAERVQQGRRAADAKLNRQLE